LSDLCFPRPLPQPYPARELRRMRKRMLKAQKFKGVGDALKLLRGFKLSYLLPEAPAIAEFSTGEVGALPPWFGAR
jgi:hypothetical protein